MDTNNSQATAGEKCFDLSLVRNVCRGNNAALIKMVSSFVNTMPPAVDEIRKAYQEKDLHSINRTAHRIKPVLSMYGILQVEMEIIQLENALVVDLYTSSFQSTIDKLGRVINLVVDEMKRDVLIS